MPAFQTEINVPSVGNLEGLQLQKDDMASFIRSASQECSVDLFCLPASDGTPMVTTDFPVSEKTSIIEESFVFVANQVALDESLQVPLAIVHVDKARHWKRIFVSL